MEESKEKIKQAVEQLRIIEQRLKRRNGVKSKSDGKMLQETRQELQALLDPPKKRCKTRFTFTGDREGARAYCITFECMRKEGHAGPHWDVAVSEKGFGYLLQWWHDSKETPAWAR